MRKILLTRWYYIIQQNFSFFRLKFIRISHYQITFKFLLKSIKKVLIVLKTIHRARGCLWYDVGNGLSVIKRRPSFSGIVDNNYYSNLENLYFISQDFLNSYRTFLRTKALFLWGGSFLFWSPNLQFFGL